MKAFIFAAATLLLATVFVCWSGWYVNQVCTGMRNILESMPGKEENDLTVFDASYRNAEKYWFDHRKLLQMIIGKRQTDEVCRRLVGMGFRYLGGDMTGYIADREELIVCLEEIGEGEKMSWKGVL